MSEEKKEEKEKVSRRKYLGAIGGLAAATAIGWGIAGYAISKPKPKPPTPAIEKTVTVTATPVVTSPITTPKKEFTITVAFATSPAFEELVKRGAEKFSEEHPDIKIKLEIVQKDWAEIYRYFQTTFAAGSPPDLPIVDSMIYPTLANLGFFEPLDERLKEWPEYTEWLPAYKNAMVLPDGHTYGLWFNTDCRPLSIWKEYYPNGFPETWEDLLKDVKRVAKAGKPFVQNTVEIEYPFMTFYDSIAPEELLKPPGWGLLELENGKWKCAINNEYGEEALKMCLELKEAGALFHSVAEWMPDVEAFNEGKYSTIMYGCWHTGELRELKKMSWDEIAEKLDMKFYPPPTGGRVHAAVPGGWVFTIPKATKIPKDLLWELIKTCLSRELLSDIFTKYSLLPTRKDVWDYFVKHTPDPFMKYYKETVFDPGRVYLFPMVPHYDRISASMYYDMIWAVLLGKKKPKEALQDYCEKVNTVLGE